MSDPENWPVLHNVSRFYTWANQERTYLAIIAISLQAPQKPICMIDNSRRNDVFKDVGVVTKGENAGIWYLRWKKVWIQYPVSDSSVSIYSLPSFQSMACKTV